MPGWAIPLVAAWTGVVAIWLFLLIAQRRLGPDGLILQPNLSGGGDLPSVCVVIPARNEEKDIDACLASVLRQDYPRLRVVIADDRSTDGTAAAAERIADADSRVHVVRISELPPAWMGKSHALWQATRGVDAEWLLFTDMDCRFETQAVRTAVREALSRRADLLSLWPRQIAGSFWEHMLIPLCGGIIALWYGSRHVNRDDASRAFANGQFLLIRRDTYERIDGHRGVRSALIEDVPLAQAARRAGAVCRVASGRDLFGVRMYTGLGSICRGWSRIDAGILSGGRIALSMLWLLLGNLLPFVAVVPLAMLPQMHATTLRALQLLCIAHLLLIGVVSAGFWRLGDCRRRYLLLYPISVVVVLVILLQAWWWRVIRRRVGWRGRYYLLNSAGRIVSAEHG